MYITKITDDYNCTNIENEDDDNFNFKNLLLSIPSSILIFSIINSMKNTLVKPLKTNK